MPYKPLWIINSVSTARFQDSRKKPVDDVQNYKCHATFLIRAKDVRSSLADGYVGRP